MRRYRYTIHLEPAEEGGFTVTVPALPGCITEGDTYEDCIANAQEAIEGFIETLIEVGEPVPIEAEPKQPMNAIVQVDVPAAA
jgi:predicted RNase H-like HicB family nuclease